MSVFQDLWQALSIEGKILKGDVFEEMEKRSF